MRVFTRSKMRNILYEADIYLKNSIGKQMVLEKVKPFNYDEEALNAGQEIYIEAERLYLESVPIRGKKVNFGGIVKKRVNNCHKIFMIHVKKLRRELADDQGLLREFGVYGPRDFSYKGKIKEAKEFYKNCLENETIGTVAGSYGLPKEKLEEYMNEIAEIESDEAYKAIVIKESEKTTDELHKAMLKLYNWCKNYKDVLVFVFQDDRQQLEAFKIPAYSEGYDPHKKKKPGEDDEKSDKNEGAETDDNGAQKQDEVVDKVEGVNVENVDNKDEQENEGNKNESIKIKEEKEFKEEEKKETLPIPLR